MKNSIVLILFIALVLPSAGIFGQCASWVGTPDEEAGSEAHSIYRSAMKSKDMGATTFENWEKAYSIAPSADGKRPFHFTDGIKLYKHKLESDKQGPDAAANKERILSLYDELVACYETGGIKEPKCEDEACRMKKAALYLGRKAVDMYYVTNAPYSKNLEALTKSIEMAGNDTEYTLFRPLADIVVYQFKKEKLTQEEARGYFETMTAIAEHNKANNERLGEYYGNEQIALNSKFKEIEREIFDCQYFIDKWEPGYRENATPEEAKRIFNQLRLQGCDETQPFYKELKETYETWAAKVNADKKAEYEANNPAILANKAYKAGNFQEALSKYQEALANETDDSKKAGYHSSIASIYFRKLNKYSEAISNARQAIKLRSGWGQPIMLLGDIYAKKSRSCGDDWQQRLVIIAAVGKYEQAKSVDPSVAADANKKLGIYRAALPDKTEGFMRKVKKGQSVNCGCGIGETVKIRFKS